MPGAPQQMSGASLAKGTTILNSDPLNAVWISSKQFVGPNLGGWKLTPQMSVDWTGAQLWACVDTGVTKNVILDTSDDVVNVSNPVGVAEALLLTGIPNVYQATQLGNTVIGVGVSQVDLPISQYASILMFLFASPSGTAAGVIARITQALSPALLFAIDSFYATAELTNNNGFIALSIPVVGNYLTIDNAHPTQACQVVTYGTNRPTASAISKSWLGFAQIIGGRVYSIVNGAAVSGSVYGGAIVDYPAGAPIPNQLALNGLYNVSGTSSLSGTLFAWFVGPDNGIRGAAIVNVVSNVAFNATGYFVGYARFVFIPSINGALNCPFTVNPGAGP